MEAKYNFRNSLFKIDIKKGLDSEDADRRDSITPQIFSSFCRADEKLYNKPILFLVKWQDPEKCLNQKSV